MMNRILTIILLFLSAGSTVAQHIYTSRNATISFYSYAPIEDIKAKSETGVAAIDINSRSVYFKVPIRSFKFRKSMMEEHFNEKYLESDKYPKAEFKGKIVEDIDLSKEGSYPVTVQGDLDIHNVTKKYTTRATLEVAGGKISASSTFNVRLVDHRITIPTLVTRNIAETLEIKVKAVLTKKD